MNLLIITLGWIGVVLVFVTYWLLVSRRLASTSPLYHLLNLGGSLLLGINFLWTHAYPGVGINAGWALIALYGLWGTWKSGLP